MFGVHCEAVPCQVNFLCNEAGDCGKGANTVVSQLHYYLENHGMGETDMYLHADNCTGQNKNMASTDTQAHQYYPLFLGSWAHKIFARLVFRSFQEVVPQDQNRKFARNSRGGVEVGRM